jgi:hypothetical protein
MRWLQLDVLSSDVDLKPLLSFTQLKSVRLREHAFLEASQLRPLACHRSLREVTLSACLLREKDRTALSALNSLEATHILGVVCGFGEARSGGREAGPDWLRGLGNVRSLRLLVDEGGLEWLGGARMASLRELCLSFLSCTPAQLATLGGLVNLSRLSLDLGHVRSLGPALDPQGVLSRLPLEQLRLACGTLSAVLPDLSGLPQCLTRLELDALHASPDAARALAPLLLRLTGLRSLLLQQPPEPLLDIAAHLPALPSLRSLTLLTRTRTNEPERDRLARGLRGLARQTALQELALNWDVPVPAGYLSSLRALSNLRRLALCACPARSFLPVVAAAFPLLERLRIDSGVSPLATELAVLAGLSSLTSLTLISAELTRKGWESLAVLPRLRELCLQLEVVEDARVRELCASSASASALRSLSILACGRSGAGPGPASLAEMTRLRALQGVRVSVQGRVEKEVLLEAQRRLVRELPELSYRAVDLHPPPFSITRELGCGAAFPRSPRESAAASPSKRRGLFSIYS